ncbi:MAG: 16S rRNA (cytidine(1402)-2'-O)-methyltransferase [Tagaea sp. CACIAM 22H2]|nr:16S rRNA (cytidine(1402)-2'-O)-methyltransferase [Tagaea sp. CACIAM 22H2]
MSSDDEPPETSDTAPANPGAIKPGLYLVATPLGNLGDISARQKAVLAAASTIAAEDTRVARRLLSAMGLIAPRLVRCDERESAAVAEKLIARVRDGEIVAFVSDAGMPGIADPGAALVRAARDANIPFTVIPGPSALTTALALSGLPAEPALFLGFLSPKQGPRARRLREFKDVPATLVAFEAPHRLVETLQAMAEVLGPREACVARELTKRHEEARSGTLPELAAHYEAAGVLGECVIVVAPASEASAPEADAETLDAKLRAALETLGVRDAADRVAAETGLKRREVYSRALELGGKKR